MDRSAALFLLDGFRLTVNGRDLQLAPQQERLVACLGVHQWCSRFVIAEALWPDRTERSALAALRTTVWRVQQHAAGVLAVGPRTVSLQPSVWVDTRMLVSWAQRVIRAYPPLSDAQLKAPALGRELLPGWYDEWLEVERRRLHQLRMHALEVVAQELIERGRPAQALPAALELIAADPLRESAHRLLIRVHIAEGNVAAALDQYELCRALLHAQVGVQPSGALAQLVSPFLGRGR
jgi:DNA-binding SARP family transcriptional activator